MAGLYLPLIAESPVWDLMTHTNEVWGDLLTSCPDHCVCVCVFVCVIIQYVACGSSVNQFQSLRSGKIKP